MRPILTSLITTVSLLFTTQLALAADYYVSPSGDDTNNTGTSTTSPWKTLQTSACKLRPGDTLHVMAGDYPENPALNTANGCVSGTPDQHITVKAYGDPADDQKPRITGPGINHRLRLDGLSHWTIDGLAAVNFKGAGFIFLAGNNAGFPSAPMDDVHFKNLYIKDSCQNTPCNDTSPLLDAPNGVGYNMVVFGTQKVEIPATNVSVTGSHFENTSTGIKTAYNENLTVLGNSDKVTISDNTFINVSFIAIDVIGANDCPGTGCINYGQPRNVIIRNNLIDTVRPDSEGNAQGIYLDRPHHNILIEDNTLVNAPSGIAPGFEPHWTKGMSYPGPATIIRNNVVLNGSNPLRIGLVAALCNPSQTPNCSQHGDGESGYNPIYDGVAVVHNVATVVGPTLGGSPLSWGQAKNASALNNILINTFEQSLLATSLRAVRDNWRSDGNIFYTNQGPGIFEFGQENLQFSFANYQQNTGQDPNSYFVAPQFINDTAAAIASRDYSLKPGTSGHRQAVPLTTTATAGDGQAVTVRDATFFFDGWQMQDEVGDWIILGDQPALVTSVNYQQKTITLDRPLTWTADQPIHYYFTDDAPSIGLLPDVPTPNVDPAGHTNLNIIDWVESIALEIDNFRLLLTEWR